MSKDVNLSRRAIVAGAAAIPATAALPAAAVAGRPDPTFAAIAAHRAAWASLERDCSRFDEEDTPEAEVQLSELHRGVDKAEDQLVEIEPTTMRGVIALLRYIAEVEATPGRDWLGGDYADKGDPALGKDGAPATYFFHRNVAQMRSKK